jgi:glycerol-3-phosphate dehydrogenase
MTAATCDVLVVGGGATGTGLARDLAMRGLRVVLVEQGDLAHGTTGRYHGLLHSGARYVVRDPESARDCGRENQILRGIARWCVEDTGGVFCWLDGDPEDYPDRFVAGCREAAIEVREISAAEALRREPLLTPELRRAFWVPDATVQSFELVVGNATSAEECGAVIRRYTRLAAVSVSNGRVTDVELEEARTGERSRVEVGCIASAAGYWAGRVAALAGVSIQMAPGWGTMVIMNQRLSRWVVNRCRLPGDGDIVVPVGLVSILGTTDTTLDTDDYEITPEEVRRIISESAAMVPAAATQRVLRVYAGARPIYAPHGDQSASRELSRSHTVLDHADQGVENFVSIVGGKLTTYRLMAEETADAVCRKLAVTEPCRTATEPITATGDRSFYSPGQRLTALEDAGGADAHLVCECELVTREMAEEFIGSFPGKPRIDDMLRALRLGVGPSQGGFCSLRAAGLLERLRPVGSEGALQPLRDFLDERMKGTRPIMWADQVRQFQLNEIMYRDVFNLDNAPPLPPPTPRDQRVSRGPRVRGGGGPPGPVGVEREA